ncbi:hypothetical protein FACS1894160_3720 [Bacteroidia bacterium]|nr:hypothetical protein FACS1894123_08630 [Bacteroidia bacterium]GHV08812.1 hypothetical protein FACS1894160_3720 [Bacteroidia bacterium]
MEQRTILKTLTISTTIVGISWAVFALITYFFANFSIGEIEKATFILFPHIAFFVMFISGIFLLGVCYLKKLKYEQEKEKLEDEYDRKREWEEFQFNLYQPERNYRETLDNQQFQLKQHEKDFEKDRQTQIFYLLASGLKLNEKQSPDSIKKKLEEIKKGYESFKSLIESFNN